MSAPDLKPCPFCGAESASIIEGTTFRWRRIQCQSCDSMGPEVRYDTLATDLRIADAESLEKATEAWNRRTP